MKLHYFQGEIPNFGDDLNPYIFNNLFPDLFSRTDDINFYGIGSILDARIPESQKNIIFGTGIRGIQSDYPSKNWDIRFVRGPISAKALQCKYIADSAYCLPLLPKSLFNPGKIAKKHKYSFVPYFRQTQNKELLKGFTDNGINIISPLAPLDEVLKEIAASEYVICGAMHGAIVADICRVPWVRFTYGVHGYEPRLISELKWADWIGSIGLDASKLIEFYPPNINSNRLLRKINQYFHPTVLKSSIADKFGNKELYQLSDNATLMKITTQLAEEVEQLKKIYC
jgi:succinoglycan biosynthesis protein ExoV